MFEVKNTIEPNDIEWTMSWGPQFPDKPPTEQMFEEEGALAHLLMNEVVFINSKWWEKACPEHVRNSIHVAVNCNDIFAWACSDAEVLPYDQIETLYRMWRDDPSWGPAKWCAIQRNQKPQKPVIDAMKKAGVWDERMESLGKNTLDKEVHELIGVPVPDYAKDEEAPARKPFWRRWITG